MKTQGNETVVGYIYRTWSLGKYFWDVKKSVRDQIYGLGM